MRKVSAVSSKPAARAKYNPAHDSPKEVTRVAPIMKEVTRGAPILGFRVLVGRRQVELSKLTDKELLRVPLSEMVKVTKSLPTTLPGRAFGKPLSRKQLLDLFATQSAIKRRASLEIQVTFRRLMVTAKASNVDLVVSESAKEIDRVLAEIIPSMVMTIEGENRQEPTGAGARYLDVAPGNAPPPSKVASEIVDLVRLAKAKAIGNLLRQPDMLSSAEFAAKLDVSRQQLNEWRKIGKVLAIEGEKRGFRYPAWQLDKDGMVFRGVGEVLAAFDGRHLAAYRFLISPLEALNRKAPLTLLGKRERGRILELAQSVQRGNFF
jgi:hypothetical protein